VDEALAEVVRLELLLLEPQVRRDPERLASLLHKDFVEYGASGRRWDRASVALAVDAGEEPIGASAVQARRLGPDAVLVTYRSDARGRRVLRSSIWVREDGRWLLLFHQGTLTDEAQDATPPPKPCGHVSCIGVLGVATKTSFRSGAVVTVPATAT
jgi:hypothetical protein